jgi:hypothetical protein
VGNVVEGKTHFSRKCASSRLGEGHTLKTRVGAAASYACHCFLARPKIAPPRCQQKRLGSRTGTHLQLQFNSSTLFNNQMFFGRGAALAVFAISAFTGVYRWADAIKVNISTSQHLFPKQATNNSRSQDGTFSTGPPSTGSPSKQWSYTPILPLA